MNLVKKKIRPAGTIEYHVQNNDTIEKIALKWNTIPSEIQHLNRLVTRVIFPGIFKLKILVSSIYKLE